MNLNELAAKTGRGTDGLVKEVVAGRHRRLAGSREMLDGRSDDLKSGLAKPVDGEARRQREDELLKHSPQ